MSPRACIAVLFLAGSVCLVIGQSVLAAPGDGDGKRPAVRQKILQRFDKNGNGQLDPDEREAAREAMQKRREQAGGKAPGGQRSQDPERLKKLLEKFDKDGDGTLNETERAAAKEARAKRAR